MRTAEISTELTPGSKGFTSKTIHSKDIRSLKESSWAFMFHKPYKSDWKEACRKAKERVEEVRTTWTHELD